MMTKRSFFGELSLQYISMFDFKNIFVYFWKISVLFKVSTLVLKQNKSIRHCNSYCSFPSSLHIFLFSLGLQIPLVQFITSFYPSISPRFSSFLSIRLSEFFGIQWAVKSHKLLLLYVWPCDRKRKRRRREKGDFLLQHFWTFPAPPVITHRHRSTRTAAKLHPPISNPLSSYKPPTHTPVPTRQHLHHFALESGSLHRTTTRGLESDKTFRHGTASSDKTNTFTN